MTRSIHAAVAVLGCLMAAPAYAAYPTKPISLVVPYGPGGASDLVARTLASIAPKYLGKPVLVQNKTGAGGIVGSNYVNKSKPNGYTLLLARVGSQAVGPALNPAVPYKYDDFTMIGLLELNPFVFAVNADSPYKTFGDLVKALKNKPGDLSYSTSGPGTVLNMGPQMLLQELGLPPSAAVQVPYKGGGGAATALLGKHVDFIGVNLSAVISGIKAGKLRALAVTTSKRYSAIPDVPTVKELGYPQLDTVVGWSALYGPRGLPDDVVARWQKALQKISSDKAWKAGAKNRGSISDIRSPAATRSFIKQQYETYVKLGKRLGISSQ